MRILVACEFTGIVRDAFRARGHDAVSCDIIPSERPGPHIQDDVMNHLEEGWDMMIAHPECRFLASSGARWWGGRQAEQKAALSFVRKLMEAPIEMIAIENPIGKISSIRKPDQIIQPWYFGDAETKATCLWLKNLPPLMATCMVGNLRNSIHMMSPSPTRSQDRSRTFPGIAAAMADQWGGGASE